MDVVTVFNWIKDAAVGGLDIILAIANGASELFFTEGAEGTFNMSFLGALVIAGVGAPLAWKFIKYIISLFNKVRPN